MPLHCETLHDGTGERERDRDEVAMLRLRCTLFDEWGEFDRASPVRAVELVATGLSSTLHAVAWQSYAKLGNSAKCRGFVQRGRAFSEPKFHAFCESHVVPTTRGILAKHRGTQRSPRLAHFGCIWGA